MPERFDLTLLGIGAIIGTGIFVLTGHAAATQSGPAVVLSFVVAGLACAFAALAYAELAANGRRLRQCIRLFLCSVRRIDRLDYRLGFHPRIWRFGRRSCQWLVGIFQQCVDGDRLGLPEALTKGPMAAASSICRRLLIILALMVMLIIGVKQTARLNAAMVAVKLLTIAFLSASRSSMCIRKTGRRSCRSVGLITTADGKTVGVLAGASLVFFAYVGFDAVSTAVEEAHDPQRDVPKGIICSLGFCTIIYIIVSALLTGIVPYTSLNVSSPRGACAACRSVTTGRRHWSRPASYSV